jgi:hypothetical protein
LDLFWKQVFSYMSLPVFNAIKSFSLSFILFVGKARSLPIMDGSPFQVGSSFTRKYFAKLEWFADDKRSGLFGLFISDEGKRFCNHTWN